jgi:hypothetical protein
MSTWKKIALVNSGALVGICISLFIVPPKTPLWLFATVGVVSVVVWNLIILRLIILRPSQNKDNRGGDSSKTNTVIIIVGFLLLMFEFLNRLGISPFRR